LCLQWLELVVLVWLLSRRTSKPSRRSRLKKTSRPTSRLVEMLVDYIDYFTTFNSRHIRMDFGHHHQLQLLLYHFFKYLFLSFILGLSRITKRLAELSPILAEDSTSANSFTVWLHVFFLPNSLTPVWQCQSTYLAPYCEAPHAQAHPFGP